MATKDLVLGIILLVASVFLVVAVLLQSGKSHNLSGSIAGGAETFFGKSKAKTLDKKLSVATAILAIVFVIVVLVVYVMQDVQDTSGTHSDYEPSAVTTVAEADTAEGTSIVTEAATAAATEAVTE